VVGKTNIAAFFATLANNVLFANCDMEKVNLYIIFNPIIEKSFEYYFRMYFMLF